MSQEKLYTWDQQGTGPKFPTIAEGFMLCVGDSFTPMVQGTSPHTIKKMTFSFDNGLKIYMGLEDYPEADPKIFTGTEFIQMLKNFSFTKVVNTQRINTIPDEDLIYYIPFTGDAKIDEVNDAGRWMRVIESGAGSVLCGVSENGHIWPDNRMDERSMGQGIWSRHRREGKILAPGESGYEYPAMQNIPKTVNQVVHEYLVQAGGAMSKVLDEQMAASLTGGTIYPPSSIELSPEGEKALQEKAEEFKQEASKQFTRSTGLPPEPMKTTEIIEPEVGSIWYIKNCKEWVKVLFIAPTGVMAGRRIHIAIADESTGFEWDSSDDPGYTTSLWHTRVCEGIIIPAEGEYGLPIKEIKTADPGNGPKVNLYDVLYNPHYAMLIAVVGIPEDRKEIEVMYDTTVAGGKDYGWGPRVRTIELAGLEEQMAKGEVVRQGTLLPKEGDTYEDTSNKRCFVIIPGLPGTIAYEVKHDKGEQAHGYSITITGFIENVLSGKYRKL